VGFVSGKHTKMAAPKGRLQKIIYNKLDMSSYLFGSIGAQKRMQEKFLFYNIEVT
jgi:hypothetical protein